MLPVCLFVCLSLSRRAWPSFGPAVLYFYHNGCRNKARRFLLPSLHCPYSNVRQTTSEIIIIILVWFGVYCRNPDALPSRSHAHGLLRADRKRLDGLTLIPWCNGRCVTWDLTVIDTVAASYLNNISSHAGSAAEAAASRKEKYEEIVVLSRLPLKL